MRNTVSIFFLASFLAHVDDATTHEIDRNIAKKLCLLQQALQGTQTAQLYVSLSPGESFIIQIALPPLIFEYATRI